MSSAARALSTAQAARPKPPKKAEQLAKLKGKYEQRSDGFLYVEYRQVYYNLMRLTGSHAQICCVMHVLTETISAVRPKKSKPRKETRPIEVEEFQFFIQDSLSSIQHALQDLSDRKIIPRRPATASDFQGRKAPDELRGWYVYSAPIESWDGIPAYKPEPKTAEPDEPATEDTDDGDDGDGGELDDLRQKKLHLITGTTTGEPLRLKPHRPTKAYEPPVPVEKVQFEAGAELYIEAILHRGLLKVSIQLPEWLLALAKERQRQGGGSDAKFSVGKNVSVASNTLTGSAGGSFAAFFEVGIQAGLPASREDWRETERWWNNKHPDQARDPENRMSMEDRLNAVKGIIDRVACGEYREPKPGEEDFRSGPLNYLRKRVYDRPLRPGKAKGVNKHDQSNQQLMEGAREFDRQMEKARGRRK